MRSTRSLTQSLSESTEEIVAKMRDILSGWMSEIGIDGYEFSNNDSDIFSEVSVVGTATRGKVDELITLISNDGYEKISKLGIIYKYYNTKLNYGVMIEYPTNDTGESNLFVHMYRGYDGIHLVREVI